MIRHLIEIGVVGTVEGEKLVKLMLKINSDNPNTSDIFIGSLMIEFLMEKGLAVMPFLDAVRDAPNRGSIIQAKMLDYGPKYGFYNLREGDDIVAAMGNFLAFLGFLKGRYRKKRKV